MTDLTYQVREFYPDDYGMILEWWDAHGTPGVPQGMLPKLGVIVQENGQDVAGLWLYMDNSVGVCFADLAVTKPGLSVRRARTALCFALDSLKQVAKLHNYGVMTLFAPEGMARIAEQVGYKRNSEGLVCLMTNTGL